MNSEENRIKIVLHMPESEKYKILICKKTSFLYFWSFSYWESIENFLEFRNRGVWNPILLEYNKAKQLALKMKNKEYLDSFIENEKVKEQNYLSKKKEDLNETCPVLEEEI